MIGHPQFSGNRYQKCVFMSGTLRAMVIYTYIYLAPHIVGHLRFPPKTMFFPGGILGKFPARHQDSKWDLFQLKMYFLIFLYITFIDVMLSRVDLFL